jgi:hypothetical protein
MARRQQTRAAPGFCLCCGVALAQPEVGQEPVPGRPAAVCSERCRRLRKRRLRYARVWRKRAAYFQGRRGYADAYVRCVLRAENWEGPNAFRA